MEMIQPAWDALEAWCAKTEPVWISWAADDAPYDQLAQPLKDYPLGSLRDAVIVVLAYIVFVVVGTLWQKSPLGIEWDLYGMRFVYNLTQVVLCSYMCVEAFMLAYRNNYSWRPCLPFDAEHPPLGNLLWLFYVSKVLDFMDTVFIIAGKKWKQLIFLHVYHHITIFAFYWLNLRVAYDGDIYLTIVLNGVIHAVMYTYYFVSMHAKDIWWKKYMTVMQMVQFVAMCTQAGYMLATNCQTFPRRITGMYLAYILSLLVLFLNYFVGAHFSKPSKQQQAAGKEQAGKKGKKE